MKGINHETLPLTEKINDLYNVLTSVRTKEHCLSIFLRYLVSTKTGEENNIEYI